MIQKKGANAERELIHMFWKNEGWTAVRVAGSGSMRYPAPDVLASKSGAMFAIECKATKADIQYLEKREVDELVNFASRAGARPLIAVRFNHEPWWFLNPHDLNETVVSKGISRDLARLRGLSFEDLTKGL